jgi:uncharacterized protein YdaT
MPWYDGTYPPSYKNQPEKLRNKAVEIANKLILEGVSEGVAIATGLKKAREYFTPKTKRMRNTNPLPKTFGDKG